MVDATLQDIDEILKWNMPKDLDEEPELINLVPIKSEFAIIDQEKWSKILIRIKAKSHV